MTNLGVGAFYGCPALTEMEFLPVEAPVLESMYSSNSADGWTYNNLHTTIPAYGDPIEIQITVPDNAVRYDSYLWERYIGQIVNSGIIGMTNSTAYLIERIQALPDTVTLENAAEVDYLNRVLGAMDKDQKVFITNLDKLTAAVEEIARLRAELPVETQPADTDEIEPPVTDETEPTETTPSEPEDTSVETGDETSQETLEATT